MNRYAVFILLLAAIAGCNDTSSSNNSHSIIADAGEDQIVDQLSTVTLSGSASGASNVLWVQASGIPVTLQNAGTDIAIFETPDVSLPEILIFNFMAYDSDGRAFIDSVTITIDIGTRFTKYENSELPNSAEQWSCVIDNDTGLMITKDLSQQRYKWAPALYYAEGLDLCGFTDWRLPIRNDGFARNSDFFGPTAAFWTSEDALTSAHAWLMTDTGPISEDKNYYSYRTRAVRDYR